MTTFKPLLGSAAQAFTITLASLAASATVGRESTAVDNRTNLFNDVLFMLWFETGTVAGNKQVLLFAYATIDDGTTYTEACTGTDAGFTRKDPSLLAYVDTIPAVTNSYVHKTRPYSVRDIFGRVPALWGLVVCNDTGAAFSATAGNNKAQYQGQQDQGA